MAKRVQRYRVSSTVMATLVGLVGEMIVNLTNNSVHVHDGVTEGGFELGLANVSNVQQATTSQAGKMSAAQVTALEAATADIAALDAALDQEILDRAAADTTISGNLTTLSGTVTTLATSVGNARFAANTEPVLLSFYQATIPTGWTLETGFDDRVPLVEATQAQGGASGGSWTITGLTAVAHQHGQQGTFATTFKGQDASIAGPAGTGFTSGHDHIVTLSGFTATASANGVTSNGAWRPLYVKVLVLSRTTWGT